MRYYFDTEFHEYKKKPLIGKAIDTIELISIGIVSEDYDDNSGFLIKEEPVLSAPNKFGFKDIVGYKESIVTSRITSRSYYAICKDFDLKAAWNANQGTKDKPDYWLRENVLKNLFAHEDYFEVNNFKEFKRLVNHFGKTREQIAEEIKEFVKCDCRKGTQQAYDHYNLEGKCTDNPEFYAYYNSYDWVVFCWLFGRMIDLPSGFPMYCRDLKQILDENGNPDHSIAVPKTNEHNALADAKWNKELHKFLTAL